MPSRYFPKTQTVDDILKRIEFSGAVAHEVFRTIPILEVRKKCLEVMHRLSWSYDLYEMEWDLRAMVESNDPLAQDYLFFYIDIMRYDRDQARRAAAFVLEVVEPFPRRASLRSRLMRNLIAYREENYQFISLFLLSEVNSFLFTISKDGGQRYSEEDWYRLTRALGLLTKHGDHRGVIGMVRDIAERIADPKMGPLFAGTGPDLQRYLLVQHRAYIREALRQLKVAQATEAEAAKLRREEG